MAGLEIKLHGFKEINQKLLQFNQKCARQIAEKGMRAGAEVIQQKVEDLAPVGKTGTLKKSITVRWHSKKAKWFATISGAGVQLDIGPEYSRTKKGYAGHLVEYGTEGHWVKAGEKKSGRGRRTRYMVTSTPFLASKAADMGMKGKKGFFGKKQWIQARPHPFMRPAVNASKDRAIEKVKTETNKIINQYFLRTGE